MLLPQAEYLLLLFAPRHLKGSLADTIGTVGNKIVSKLIHLQEGPNSVP